MARTKRGIDEDAVSDQRLSRKSPRQRGRQGQADSPEPAELSPSKRRRTSGVDGGSLKNGNGPDAEPDQQATPQARKRGRRGKEVAEAEVSGHDATPSGRRSRRLLETPTKTSGADTPSRRSLADRSARRKSERALID